MPTAKTLLIIDDDDDLREALAEQLALHEEFKTVQASTATEGVRLGREIRAAFETGKPISVSVLCAMGHEQIVAMKEDAEAK
jgi:ActR/RegA family two-component response regulator